MKNPSAQVNSAVQPRRPRNRSKITAAVTAALMSAPVVMPAYGQESGDDVSVLMEEIVVTARKREENIQDTPIAVSAFSGASLEARGIEKIDGIAAITPNMTFDSINTNGGGTNASIYIRGVGQTDFLPSADPGVGLYVDGVYIARSIGAVLDLIDIERVEVLRGPQGTLFGRNTVGGAVSIHTIKPHSEFDAKVKVKLGSDDRQDISARINVPLTENLFTSFSAAKFEQDGFVDNPITGDDTGDDDTWAVRGALRWQATDSLLIDIAADYSEDDENGQPRVSTSDPSRAVAFIPPDPDDPSDTGSGGFSHNFFLGANSPFNGPGAPFPPQGIPDKRQFNNCDATPGNIEGTNSDCANASTVGLGRNTGNEEAYYEADIWGASVSVEWDITDTLRLRSITAYRDLDSEFGHDGDNSPFYLSWVRDEYEQDQFSQELQLLGTFFDGGLDWIIGAYYFDEEGENFNPVDFADVDIESGGDFDNESEAFFAQGTYHFLERWHFTAGIRYTDDTKDFTVKNPVQTVFPIIAPPGTGSVVLIENGTYTLEEDDWTPMFNLAFDWTDDLMVYATYSEGFKSGGVQQRNAGVVVEAPTYKPEYVDSYELGFKFSSADGSFVLNGAGFYSDYTDIQLETLAPEGIAPQLENSGEAEIYGVELETRWAPLDSLFFEAAVGYMDAEITEADEEAAGGPADGDTLPFTPEWNYSVSAIYIWDMADWGTLTPRVDYSWRDDVYFTPDNDPGNTQDSFGIWNASIQWTSPSDRYAVSAHWLNIADEDYLLYSEIAGSSSTGNDILGRPDEWYVTAEVRF